jgi:hypothetical protein
MVLPGQCNLLLSDMQVYSLTKDPLLVSGLMEIIPAIVMALFAGHIVDQNEKKSLLLKCIWSFSVISFGLFLLTWPTFVVGILKK